MNFEYKLFAEGYLLFDDFVKGQDDALLIPYSSNGNFISTDIEIIDELNLLEIPGKSNLGDIKIIHLHEWDKFIIYACVENDAHVSLATIRSVMLSTAKYATTVRISSIVMPAFSRNRQYWANVYSKIIFTAFAERSFKPRLTFIGGKILPYDPEEPDYVTGETSAQIAFRYTLPEILEYEWLKSIISLDKPYYELATKKFKEFKNFSPPTDQFFNFLLNGFDQSGLVFQDFLVQGGFNQEYYDFLVLCGQLIAYCDRNAYNKKKWNEYSDFRTLARSGVKQTNWVSNLLKYKAAGNDLSELSPSIRNAILFLEDPSNHLTMLSENHRQMVAEHLWKIAYRPKEFEKYTFDIFAGYGVYAEESVNTGVLYSRILYAPEITPLWLNRDQTAAPALTVDITPVSEQSEPTLRDEPAPQPEKKTSWKSLIHADIYSETDHLGYRAYADVLAAFLTSPMTKAPLTIGIMAPWGKGKTNVMHFIKDRMDAFRPKSQSHIPQPSERETTYKILKEWLKNKSDKLMTITPPSYPAVWFNAWKFQKNEQIWAGLAHEIITQLAEKLSPVERQKFWLKLNLKRIDRDKIQKDIMFKLMSKLLFPALVAVIGILIGLVIKAYQGSVASVLSPVMSFGSILTALIWGAWKYFDLNGTVPEADISKYLHQPQYKEKMGYYNAVEDDLRQALDLLSDKNHPPIIFIDDLDRCSPAAVTELMEAINLFISGDISRCFFVIGLDAQVVAASLDVTYDKLREQASNVGNQHGSIGWYFLEKFIQLQFNLPVMQQRQATRLLMHLFDIHKGGAGELTQQMQELMTKYQSLESQINVIDEMELLFNPDKIKMEVELLTFAPELVEQFQQKVIARAITNHEIVEDELVTVIDNVSAYLTTSPRMIKRFTNLFIFYRFLQFSGTCPGIRDLGLETIGYLTLVMVRWPQLVRAIQWDNDRKFLNGEDALDRAKDMEALFAVAKNYEDWLSKCRIRSKILTWQSDRQLYFFFRTRSDDNLLNKAVSSGMW